MTTNQATPQKDMNRNPGGRGGFGDNPQNRNPGGWKKEESISYQYNKLLRMSPDELEDYSPETVAQKIALQRLQNAIKSDGLNDTREVTDRTEGKAPQFVGIGDKNDYRDSFGDLTAEELRNLASKQ